MRRATHSERGFSLAEAIVAISILGLIGILVFGTFARAMNARDQAEEITSHYHQVRQGMLRMTRELQMAFISHHRDCDEPRTKTIFKAKGSGSGTRIDFTSFSHYKLSADANESDQNELSYFVGAHPDDGQRSVLFRREQARIDDEPDEGGIEQVLIEDVKSFALEFYDPKEDEWEDEWDADDIDYKHRLPMFVKIELKVEGPNEEEEVFVTKTRIFLRDALQQLGTGFRRCPDI